MHYTVTAVLVVLSFSAVDANSLVNSPTVDCVLYGVCTVHTINTGYLIGGYVVSKGSWTPLIAAYNYREDHE